MSADTRPMALPIVERLRGYYTMDAGKPMFDSSKRVHRAADLHEAANAIEGIVDELIAAEQALVRAQRKFIEFDKPDQHQECMNAAYHIRQVLAKLGGEAGDDLPRPTNPPRPYPDREIA